jgi:hypothetical protein
VAHHLAAFRPGTSPNILLSDAIPSYNGKVAFEFPAAESEFADEKKRTVGQYVRSQADDSARRSVN